MPQGTEHQVMTAVEAGEALQEERPAEALPAETMEALVQAAMAGSQMNNTAYHNQSGQLVASTLINVLGSVLGGKKR